MQKYLSNYIKYNCKTVPILFNMFFFFLDLVYVIDEINLYLHLIKFTAILMITPC